MYSITYEPRFCLCSVTQRNNILSWQNTVKEILKNKTAAILDGLEVRHAFKSL